MHTTNTYPLALALVGALVGGCGEPSELASSDYAQTERSVHVDLTALDAEIHDGVVAGERAYLALGGAGVAVVDRTSGDLLDRWQRDEAGEQLWIDGLQRTDEGLLGWGLVEEETPGEHWEEGWSKSMVVAAFDDETGAVVWRQTLDLTDVLVPDPSRAILIEMPVVEATAAEGWVTVSLRSTQIDDRLLRFPTPGGDVTHRWDEVPGAVPLAAPRGPRGLFDTGDGVLVACGNAGLRRVNGDDDAEVAPHLGFAIDVRPLGDRLVVADGDGFVQLVDGDGTYLGGEEAPAWVAGLDVDGDDVVAVLRDGLVIMPSSSLLDP